MAEDAGLFKKHGLNAELIDMEGGTRGLQVLLSGQIQAMHVRLGPRVRANTQGADMRLIASFCNTIPFTIFTPANVKTAADLKGSTVGISSFGSESDSAIARIAPSASRPSHPRANRGESGGKTRRQASRLRETSYYHVE